MLGTYANEVSARTSSVMLAGAPRMSPARISDEARCLNLSVSIINGSMIGKTGSSFSFPNILAVVAHSIHVSTQGGMIGPSVFKNVTLSPRISVVPPLRLDS